MDILGRQGEEALENVDHVSRKIQSLESHLDAVDSALHDFMDGSRELLANEYEMERRELAELNRVSRQEAELEEDIEERLASLEAQQNRIEGMLDQLVDSGLLESISAVREEVNRIGARLQEVEDLRERVNEVENELVLEINSRDFEFDKKLDKKEFEKEKRELTEEIRKLRSSVNVLADELDRKEEVEVG